MSTAILDSLSRQIQTMERANRSSYRKTGAISSGCKALDSRLPRGGYEPGTIVEFLESSPGGGGWYLALAAAREAVGESKYWVVVDRRRSFFPPAAQAMGLPLDRLIVLQPTTAADEAWAIDQALRCSAIGAVVAEIEHVSELQARRCQLAAEQGQTLGLWLRPTSIQKHPSWAEIQWLLEPIGSARHSEIVLNTTVSNPAVRRSDLRCQRMIGLRSLRMRGGQSGLCWLLTIDLQQGTIALEETHAIPSHLHLASQLAMPASAKRSERRASLSTIRAAGA